MKYLNPYILSGLLLVAGCASQAAITVVDKDDNPIQISSLPAQHHLYVESSLEEDLEESLEDHIDASKKTLPLMVELMELKHKLAKVLSEEEIDKKSATRIHKLFVKKKNELEKIQFNSLVLKAEDMPYQQRKDLRLKLLKNDLISIEKNLRHGKLPHHVSPLQPLGIYCR